MATLTLQDVTRLATILEWCQHNTHVRWLNERDDLVSGTVRSIGSETGGFLRADEDVREAHVRITLDSGFEWFPPVSALCRLIRSDRIGADQ